MDLVVIIKLMLSLLGSTAIIVVGISYLTYKNKQKANRLAPVRSIAPQREAQQSAPVVTEYIVHQGDTRAFSNFEMQPAMAIAGPQISYMEQMAYANYREQEQPQNRKDRFQVINNQSVNSPAFTRFSSERPFYTPASRTVVHEAPVSKRILSSYADNNEPMYRMNY